MSKHIICLDTNTIIDNPRIFFDFPNSIVVLPIAVLQELDNLKNSTDSSVRRQSRIASNILDGITEVNQGKINMTMDNGGELRIERGMQEEFESYEPQKPDNRIISVAVGYAKKGYKVILYSNDINVRVQLRQIATDMFAERFPPDEIPLKAKQYKLIDKPLVDIDSGVRDIILADNALMHCRNRNYLDIDLNYLNGEHIVLKGESNPDKNQVLCTYDAINKRAYMLPDYKRGEPIWLVGGGNEGSSPVRPRDSRQCFLAHDILDTNKNLHFVLSRVAGAGKNFITTACALKLLKMGHYDRLIVIKPMIAVGGEKTGYLPGGLDEKMAPWFESFNDTITELTNDRGLTQDLEAKIELDIVTHMRGRSIPRTIMIIDEAQNFSELDLKTLGSRAGEGSKIILMGDLSQIDNPRLDSSTCGLRVWAERARKLDVGYGKSTYILLDNNFRSELSAWFSSFYE